MRLILFALLCLPDLGACAAEDDLAKILNDAQTALQAWDSGRALELYEQALKERPSDAQKCGIYRDMGATWLRTMEQKKALPLLRKSLKCDSKDSWTHYWLSVYYYGLKDGDKYLKHLELAAELGPENYLAQFQMAGVESSEKNFSQAAMRLEKAAQYAAGKEEEPGILRAWSAVLVQMGSFDKALEINSDIAKRFPDQDAASYAYASSGYVFYKQGKNRQAFDMYQKAIQCAGAEEKSYFDFITLAISLGELDAALKAAEQLENISRNPSRVLYNKGLLYYCKGDLNSAEKAFHELLSAPSNSGNILTRICLVKIYREKGDNEKLRETVGVARKILGNAINDSPKDPKNYWTLAWLLAEAGQDLDEAKAMCDAGQRLEPDNAESNHLEGLICFEKGDYRSAIRLFSKLVEGEKMDYLRLGKAYLRVGDRKAAVDTWRKGLKVNPKDRFLLKALRTSSSGT